MAVPRRRVRQRNPYRANKLKQPADQEEHAMSIVTTSAVSTGLVTIRKPVTPKRIAATK
jgi:hypothetical protein